MRNDFLKNNFNIKYLGFDFETEDLNLSNTHPWQFSIFQSTLSNEIKFLDLFPFKENIIVSKEAAEITKFKIEDYRKKAVDCRRSFEVFNDLVSESQVVFGHNILGFDIPIYKRYCKKFGLEDKIKGKLIIDTLQLLKAYKEDIKFNEAESFLCFQLKLKNKLIKKRGYLTLSAGAKEFDIEFDSDKLHDAKYDIELNFKLLKELIKKFDILCPIN